MWCRLSGVRRLLRSVCPVLCLALLLLLVPASVLPAPGQEPPSISRLAGPNRVETAIQISADDWSDAEAGAVVLAREDEFSDAIAGGPLAAATRGPLLLTPRGSLAANVEAELRRVLPAGRTVYLLGGTAALAEPVADRLSEIGYMPVRLAGGNRYETALAVAEEAAPDPGFLTIATGNDFPDALIAGSLAATFQGGALLLSDGDELPQVVQDYLADNPDVATTTIGPAAQTAYPEAFNVGGATAADRSVAAAEAFYDRETLRPDGVALASVERFPDALAGAPHAYLSGPLPLLLTPEDALPASLTEYVTGLEAAGLSYVYGGNATINESVVDQLQAALSS